MPICRNLCRSCLIPCGKKGVKKRSDYQGFEQMTLFQAPVKVKKKLARLVSWDEYGISRERHMELCGYCRSGLYADLARVAAYTANPDIAEYILLSVTQKKSYEAIEYDRRLGRIPCGRTDFYGYRRLFYSLFERELNKVQNTS